MMDVSAIGPKELYPRPQVQGEAMSVTHASSSECYMLDSYGGV